MNLIPDDKMVTLNFRLGEILRVDAHFGRQMPILFMNLTPVACARARGALGMRDPTTGLWLDNMSKGKEGKFMRLNCILLNASTTNKLVD